MSQQEALKDIADAVSAATEALRDSPTEYEMKWAAATAAMTALLQARPELSAKDIARMSVDMAESLWSEAERLL